MSVIITYNLSNTSFVSVVLLIALKNNRIVKLNYSIISNMKIQNITLITMPVPIVIVICVVSVVVIGIVAEAIYTTWKNITKNVKPPLSKSEIQQ